MDTIAAAEMLSEIRSATDQTAPFLIRFVKGSGKNRGAIRTLPQVIKGTPRQTERAPATGKKSGRGVFLHKEFDTIPLIDLSAGGRMVTVLISHIIQYKSFKVIH